MDHVKAIWQRAANFLTALRAGDPVATWLSQTSPMLLIVPLSLWLSSKQGNLLPTILVWGIGSALSNILWIPHLRRNQHPPPGTSQSVAAATSLGGIAVVPSTWLLLSIFIALGVILGIVSGGRRHPTFQFVCLLVGTYIAVATGISELAPWVIFVLLIVPFAFAARAFVAAELAQQQRRIHTALSTTGATAWDIDSSGVVQGILGTPIERVEVGTRLSDLIHPDDRRPTRPEPGARLEYRIAGTGDSWRWIRETVEAASPRQSERRSGVVDTTDEKAASNRDRRLAVMDQLTEIPNRAEHIERAEAMASKGSGHLILVDLDDFKRVNDTLGHSVGDMVLKHVAARLAAVDPVAHISRLGGDEFACLISGDADTANHRASRLTEAAAKPLTIQSMIVYSGASAGVAPFASGVAADEVRRRAGVALHAAKANAKNVVFYDDALEVESRRRQRLATELPLALTNTNNEFVVFHQPKLDLQLGSVVGYEALVRWRHPEFGILGPFDFLDLIAVGGHHRLLYPLVLEQALADLVTLSADSGRELTMAVNVHSRNLREPDLVDLTLASLDLFGLSPERLTLELTEDALVADDKAVLDALFELHDAGVRLSVDDFGTGFSSLSYLSRLPVSEVKLDRSLVSEIDTSARGRAVAESVLGLAARLDMRVVAEGIEEGATLEYLADRGCPLGQGYFIGRPAPVEAWIEQRTAAA